MPFEMYYEDKFDISIRRKHPEKWLAIACLQKGNLHSDIYFERHAIHVPVQATGSYGAAVKYKC